MRIDIEVLAGGAMEREIRPCSGHAYELLARRLGVPSRTLDNWLWNCGLQRPYTRGRRYLTRTVAY
jgi:hypothetical protein